MKSPVELTNYDNIAEIYIPHTEKEDSWNNLYERPNMLASFDNFNDKHVVDIGCGSGFYTNYALSDGAVVTAVDASQKMLDYVQSAGNSERLTLIRSDLLNGLPFICSNSQHYIICSLVLHYIEKWDLLLSDFYRVLQPKGRVHISVHHPFGDYLHLNKKSYFDSYFVEDVWGRDDKPFKVYYYTKTLSQILRPILESPFLLEKVDEPLPNEDCKRISPFVYSKLKTRPSFLFITLSKAVTQ